jgi:hypothetical protein
MKYLMDQSIDRTSLQYNTQDKNLFPKLQQAMQGREG